MGAIIGRISDQPRRAIVIGCGVLAFLILMFALVIPACNAALGAGAQQKELPSEARVSFVAVGDNIPDDYIGLYADELSGELGDGSYDYKPILEHVKPSIEAADLAYVDQETHCGGNELGVRGYPSFNTTDEMADAIVDAGFDLVASATNHSYDWGSWGALEHSVNLWKSKPVTFTGTSITEEQYNSIATTERNGITFALLNYTYGVNGLTKEELPAYSVNFIDEERIASDVTRAKESADVVMVAMHWGTENLTEANEEQTRLAQLLADLDVDIVLGSHPHVIGPVEWVQNSNGEGHSTLVAYSLGNFIADHESPSPINIIEGMLTCDFVRDANSESVRIENPTWVPLVMHSSEDRSDFAVYAIDDYPEDLAKKNRVFLDNEDPIGWIKQTTADVTGWYNA